MTNAKRKITVTGAIVILLALSGATLSADIQRHIRTYDFIENQSSARIIRQTETNFRDVSCGQTSKPALFQHAGILGTEWVKVTYPNVQIPGKPKGVQSIYLHFFTGIEDGEDFKSEPGVDGCRFILFVDGKRVWSRRHRQQDWSEHQVSLARYAGKQVDISFLIDPIRSSTADRAAWGRPRIYIEGKGEFIDALATQLGQMPPDQTPKPIEGPQQITRVNKDDKSVTMVAVLDATQDADSQFLIDESSENIKGELSPRVVAGQNADPENHTLVRILSEHGTSEIQFLAYPASITGGVQVEAGKDNLGYLRIVTAPLTDTETCSLRIFNEHGGFVREIPIRSELSAPFVINVGQYDPERPGEEIAVTSRRQKAGCPLKILYYGIDGAYITHQHIPIETDTAVTMTTQKNHKADILYVYLQNEDQLKILDIMEDGRIETAPCEPGLLESINPKGTIEEIVPAVPFRHHINVERLSTYGVNSENAKDFRIGPLDGLQAGSVIEITFKAKTDSDGRFTFGIYQDRTLLEGLFQEFAPPVDKWKYYRFIFRIQRPADGITLRLRTDRKIQLDDFNATRQTEQTASPASGHIPFDILE